MKTNGNRCAAEFRRAVTMTPAEIRAWARNPEAKIASFESTRRRLPGLAALKAKNPTQWTASDCRRAGRVVAFVKRFQGMARTHGCTTKIRVALRNWGARGCER